MARMKGMLGDMTQAPGGAGRSAPAARVSGRNRAERGIQEGRTGGGATGAAAMLQDLQGRRLRGLLQVLILAPGRGHPAME